MFVIFRFLMIWSLIATGYLSFGARAIAQPESVIPPYFRIVREPSGDIHKALTASKSLAAGESHFWLGYRFDLRTGVRLDNISISDDGGINVYHRPSHWGEDDDLETAALRALSELGDESARARLRQRQTGFESDNWGVFFLVEARTLEVAKIKLLDFERRKAFGGHPIFWLQRPSSEASFRFLTDIINDDRYQKRVVEPAVFVLSLLQHENVISYLSGLASGERYLGIRESAVFWLGTIPTNESLTALVDLYARVRSHDLKEKIIFSMSQHDGDDAASALIDIAGNDTEAGLREKAIFWLGQMAGRKILAALGEIVANDEDTEIKTRAVFAISQHPDEHLAADMLMEIARNNPNPEVRRKAMFWLGQTGDKRAVHFFEEILLAD